MGSWWIRNRWAIGQVIEGVTQFAFLVFAVIGAIMMIRMMRYWDDATAQNKEILVIGRHSLQQQQVTNGLLRGISAKLGASGHPIPAGKQ